MKKSNFGLGKKKPDKYKPVDIDEPNDNVQVYKPVNIEARKSQSESVKKFNNRDWERKQRVIERLNKVREKKKKEKGDKRGVLIIKDYMSFLHEKYGRGVGRPMEVHHWMPKSRIRHNDFFVCCLDPKDHWRIHHGGSSVNEFIESRGIENLLMDSAIMFANWLGSRDGHRHRYREIFKAMIMDIYTDPCNYEYVLETTRRYAEEIRLLRGKE